MYASCTNQEFIRTNEPWEAGIRKIGVTVAFSGYKGEERFDSVNSDQKENLLKVQIMKKQGKMD